MDGGGFVPAGLGTVGTYVGGSEVACGGIPRGRGYHLIG